MAVGPNHIVQWVNNGLVVFGKDGNQLAAPVADSTFWGSGSTCNQLGGYSDPIIEYDRAADRWIVGEVAIPAWPGVLGQYAQCFAVSKTSDPTYASDANGNNTSYYIWAYGFGTTVPDYDKIAVWSDAFYVTWNIFPNGGNNFSGPEACAWDRTQMLSGVGAPSFKCFQLSSSYASLLPADLDGATAPPAGSPNFLMNIDTGGLGALYLWKFHVDFKTLSNSTFTGPTSIAGVAGFTAACAQNCIPQPGTTENLDALGDRLMYRLAYRNFGDHESLVANHSVLTAGGNTGVRWYEVRSPSGTPTLYQQGTYAPDTTDNRWMASIAMDKSGDIGVGYSVSSSVTYPSIRYTGWEVGNTTGTLQAETSLVAGGGSQTGYTRWGDYSAMRTDPSDDCTFWYTQEYQAITQSGNWNTRIGSFKFSSCGQALTATTTTLTSSPNPSNSGQAVTFTATVSPATATGSVQFFDTSTSTSLGTQTLSGGIATLATSTLTVGTHSITATYSGDSNYAGSTSGTVSQMVSSTGDFTISASPASLTVSRGSTATYTVTVTAVNSFTGTVNLSVSGLPNRSSASFSPPSVSGSGASTLTVHTGSKTARGTYTLTIIGTSGGLVHSTTVQLTVK